MLRDGPSLSRFVVDPWTMPMNLEECFDVVDENDCAVGKLTRSEVHRRGLRHRAVHVFLFRQDGCMLIHKRSETKEEFPSVWTSSCSGHVSAGEDYDETAPRELLEELGIAASVERLRKFAACDDTSQEFTVLYRTVSDAAVRPDPVEMTDIRWLSIDSIRDWMRQSPEDFSPAFRLLFGWFSQTQAISE